MKKIFYLFLLLPLFMSACSSDDDKWEDATVNNLIGRWQLTHAGVKSVNTNIPELTKELSKQTNIDMGTPMVEFKGDGSYINESGDKGSYTLRDNTIYVTVDGYTEAYNNVVIKGNSLQWDLEGKDNFQSEIDLQYPNQNIIIYDFTVNMKFARK